MSECVDKRSQPSTAKLFADALTDASICYAITLSYWYSRYFAESHLWMMRTLLLIVFAFLIFRAFQHKSLSEVVRFRKDIGNYFSLTGFLQIHVSIRAFLLIYVTVLMLIIWHDYGSYVNAISYYFVWRSYYTPDEISTLRNYLLAFTLWPIVSLTFGLLTAFVAWLYRSRNFDSSNSRIPTKGLIAFHNMMKDNSCARPDLTRIEFARRRFTGWFEAIFVVIGFSLIIMALLVGDERVSARFLLLFLAGMAVVSLLHIVLTAVSIIASIQRRTANLPDDAYTQQNTETPTAKRLRYFRPTNESLYRDIIVMLLYVIFLSFAVMFGGYYLFSGVLLTKTAIAVSVIYALLLLANSVRRIIKAE